jgi:hypothetical protein
MEHDMQAILALIISAALSLIESWSRLSERFFRFDKWSLCRG